MMMTETLCVETLSTLGLCDEALMSGLGMFFSLMGVSRVLEVDFFSPADHLRTPEFGGRVL
jgi:hypothetical protein